MFIYIAIFIYLLFLAYYFDIKKGPNKYKRLHYIFSCIVLILVAGFRYRIGYDTINYMESFTHAPTLRELKHGVQLIGDPLWMLIMAVSKAISNDFFVVQLIQATIVNHAVFWFIRRHSPKPFIAVLFYFLLVWWNLCFEAMREAIAVAFFLYGLDALLCNKGLKSYYFRVWPAVFAHSFGFVTLLFPFIKYLNFRRFSIIIYAMLLVVLFTIKDYINDLTVLLEMFSEVASEKAIDYLNSDDFGESYLSINGIISLVLGSALPGFVVFIMLRQQKNIGNNNLVPFVFIYVFFVIMRMQIPIFFRFLNYFEILVIVAFTQVYVLERKKIKRQLLTLLMVGMVALRMYSLTSYDTGTTVRTYHRYVPYNSIFQKDYHRESEMIFNSY